MGQTKLLYLSARKLSTWAHLTCRSVDWSRSTTTTVAMPIAALRTIRLLRTRILLLLLILLLEWLLLLTTILGILLGIVPFGVPVPTTAALLLRPISLRRGGFLPPADENSGDFLEKTERPLN
ncbi:MAG: hypothetical protein J6R63_05460 [Kiritimatiellae bacterium]|nr:hypothetical protein [Kiritimatiellia bacterium]